MIKVNVKLPLGYDDDAAKRAICKALFISVNEIEKYSLLKLSVDARDKENVFFSASFCVSVKSNERKILQKSIFLYFWYTGTFLP